MARSASDLRFNRPDIILRRMDIGTPQLIAAYESAFKRRLARSGVSAEAISSPVNTAEAHIEDWKQQGSRFEFTPALNDGKGDIVAWRVWVNGVPAFGRTGYAVEKQGTARPPTTLQLQLSSGSNHIEVSGVTTGGLESLRGSIDVFNPEAMTQPRLHILAIGVSRYDQASYNLNYADKDAADLVALFQKQAGLRYGHISVDLETNEKATRSKIIAGLQALRSVSPDDYVLIFLAGHGLLDNELNYYFADSDIDFANPAHNGISFDMLDDALYAIPSRHKIVLIDSCHAGELDKAEVKVSVDAMAAIPPVPGYARGVVVNEARGMRIPGFMSVEQSSDFVQSILGELRRGSGASIISASAGAQFSFESGKYRNGIFTYETLQGLETGDADLNHDGVIDVSELRQYVSSRVSTMTGGRQRPTSRGRDMVEMAVANVPLLIRSYPVHAPAAEYEQKETPIAAQTKGYFAAAAAGNYVQLFDLRTGDTAGLLAVPSPEELRGRFSSQADKLLAFTDDNNFLVAVANRHATVWELSSRTAKTIDPGSLIYAAALTPSGTLVLLADREFQLWDLHLQKRIRSVPTLPPSLLLRAFEVSADLSIAIAVAGGSHDTLSAWDLRSGEELWHKDFKHTLHVNLSPDSKQVLAVVMPDHLGIGAPEELVLFNALAGKVESSVPFPDAKAAVASLQFAADGKAVVLGVATPGRFGSTTGTAQIWSLPDLKPIAPGLRQEGWIYRLAFGKNGTRLLTSTKEGEVRLWDAAPLLDDLHLRQRQDATAK